MVNVAKMAIRVGMTMGFGILMYALYLWYVLHPEWTNPVAYRQLLPYTIPGVILLNGGYLLLQLVKAREIQSRRKAKSA